MFPGRQSREMGPHIRVKLQPAGGAARLLPTTIRRRSFRGENSKFVIVFICNTRSTEVNEERQIAILG